MSQFAILGPHAGHRLPEFGYEPMLAKYLNTFAFWDHSIVSPVRGQSKCPLMDSAVKKLDVCTKRRDEFTSIQDMVVDAL